MRFSLHSKRRVPSNSARPCSSRGKCAGTQSMITPMPALCRVSINSANSSGVP